MAKAKKIPVVQIFDGAWYALADFTQDICCGCGLVHDTEYKVENGKIMFRATVNQAATRKQRREHGIRITRKDNA